MPRKKVIKRTSPKIKKVNTLILLKKMEQDWMKSPAKLTSTLNKEITNLKQNATKIKKSINKHKIQPGLKGKQKNTKSSGKIIISLDKQLQKISNTLDIILKKKEKLVALCDHIAKFEKEWPKKSNKSLLQVKKKTKNAPRKPKSLNEQPKIEQAQKEPQTMSPDAVNVPETAESIN